MLTEEAFTALDLVFCPMILKAHPKWRCYSVSNGYMIKTDAVYTGSQLNKITPNITFTFDKSSGPVNFTASTYMIYQGGNILLVVNNLTS